MPRRKTIEDVVTALFAKADAFNAVLKKAHENGLLVEIDTVLVGGNPAEVVIDSVTKQFVKFAKEPEVEVPEKWQK